MKVLMVCLGNICRSPLAEGILKDKVNQQNLSWVVDSAGTGSWHVGELPDSRSIATAHAHNIDINDQRARQFSRQDLEDFDLILAMDSSNYQNIVRHANERQKSKVHMILNFLHPGMNQSVPDPYYGGDDGFEKVYQMLDEACDRVIETMKEKV